MKVALVGESLWLTHEALLLRHLVFGLNDEFVRVVPVFPLGAGPDELPGVTERLIYRRSRFEWMTALRLRRLTKSIEAADVDLIHLLDGKLAGPIGRLAAKLELPLVVNCWSVEQARRVRRATDGSAVIIAPTPAIAEAAEDAPHRLVRPGVMRRDESRPPLAAPEQSLCVLLLVESPVRRAVPAFMEGVARIRHELPQLQIFAYPMQADAHGVWMAGSKLNLLSQLSMVGPEVGTQELLMQADAVVLAQPIQRVWTLPLAAMAAARPIAAPLCPLADYMIPGNTCEQAPDPTDPAAWAGLLTALVRRPEHFASLGRSARTYVQQRHGIGQFVNDILAVYKDAAAEPIKFHTAR